MNRIFIGYDERQPISYQVLHHSILRRASEPVSIAPLIREHLPISRKGLTSFTYSRFLVPWLCRFDGWALFLDSDMLCLGDISELFALADERSEVMVVQSEKRFERASLMLFNCNRCGVLTPDHVETAQDLHGIGWADQARIGALPPEWNHLVGYDPPRDDVKLLHYTAGVPIFAETQKLGYVEPWLEEARFMTSIMPWHVVMGRSVHAHNIEG